MARGWESKSVEDQIEAAAAKKPASDAHELNPAQLETLRAKENLELSRIRVIREIENSKNARYREILQKALADLESKLALLERAKKASAAAGR